MAGVSSSIHFRGKGQALQAYRDRNVAVWSLWQGRQFMFKGDDEVLLDSTLQMLQESGSQAIYTVRVYEGVDQLSSVKSSTADDGSFNFRLNDIEGYGSSSMPGAPLGLHARIDKIEAMIAEMAALQLAKSQEEEEQEEADQAPDLIGTIIGVLKEPEKLERLVRVGRVMMGLDTSPSPSYVGNVTRIGDAPAAAPASGVDDRLQRLGNAIDTLEKADPKLIEHLEKLAVMAVSKPDTFRQVLGMLEVF